MAASALFGQSPKDTTRVGYITPERALSTRERASFTQVASYSAGRDVPAKLISEPSTGTNLDIAATDQIRPIATTTAIPTIHARICIPSASR